MRISELRARDIVNVSDGKRLGLVSDAEIDLDDGRIIALVVPGAARLFGLLGALEEVVIPWNDVVTVGEDVILVRWKSSHTGSEPKARANRAPASP